MKSTSQKPSLSIILAFSFCFIWWIYLAFTSKMVILFDSIGYERLGTLLAQKGWIAYFTGGPSREPLYPFFISLAMRLGNFLSISYQSILVVFQFALLSLTQFLTLHILEKLKVRAHIIAGVLLYMGLSPALVNSALSLYSEIAATPFILLIILASVWSWQSIFSGGVGKTFLFSCVLALACIAVTMVKGIFEAITPLLMIPFFTLLWKGMRAKDKWLIKNTLVFLCTVFIIYEGGLGGYKSLNKKYNGRFVLTDRGAWALYGNTARRIEKMTGERFLAALATVPGEGVCRALMNPQDCAFWSAETSDNLGSGKLLELRQKDIASADTDKILLRLSFKKALSNPFQYAVLMILEGGKMMFWESTRVGYVDYPGWLTRLYECVPFKSGLRLILALITSAALSYLTLGNWIRRKDYYTDPAKTPEDSLILLFIFRLIVFYILAHSLFFVVTRYIFPVAPLYLITAGFAAQKLFPERKRS